jgi:ectoine hydroxylase-related dioxygenase (phytanoyl-CoA dioxygenase family)
MKTSDREKYQVSLDQRHFFGCNGYLKVEGLLSDTELRELDAHSMNLLQNKVDLSQIEGLEPRNDGTSPADIEEKYFRFIQFHRHLEIHERFMLHPRVLDVLEALIGPDLMAMQSMLFFKPPGHPGQAFHQDPCFITSAPDTLCGAWFAIDDCDEGNGCMSFIPGSNLDPIYENTTVPENTEDFHARLFEIAGVDKSKEILAEAKSGDVIFFHGHLIHRSHRNRSKDRYRRAFVSHYANARSYTEWSGGNGNQILVRGATHLPFARSRFIEHKPEPIEKE